MSTTSPAEAPPSYDQATGSSSSSAATSRPHATSNQSANHLSVPGSSNINDRNGIPAQVRRSMEDFHRPLPKGWVRTFDPSTQHQFFVDTTQDPPRSIWTHPHDDQEFLSSLPAEERERIEQESLNRGAGPSHEDLIAEHSDEDDDAPDHDHPPHHHPQATSELPPRPDGKERSFGRKLKDKVTGTTHAERERERAHRAELERQAYEQHMRLRNAMAVAARTGQPQHVGKDRDGRDVYVEPPAGPPAGYYGGMGGGGGYGYNPYYGGGGYGANSYRMGGPGIYTTPNAMHIRPAGPYNRPYGSGFGGGYGLPLALGGGLLGGMLLGGAIGGF